MLNTKPLVAALLGLALTCSVAASPASPVAVAARDDVPEVIPGPGLPSLASLNLTSAELYAMPKPTPGPDGPHTLFTAECGPSESAYTNVNNIIACYHYLQNLGTQACAVPGNFGQSIFCSSGAAVIVGEGLGSGQQSSYCRDVASGALWVIDHCTRPDQSVAGFNAAGGNGGLIVGCVAGSYL